MLRIKMTVKCPFGRLGKDTNFCCQKPAILLIRQLVGRLILLPVNLQTATTGKSSFLLSLIRRAGLLKESQLKLVLQEIKIGPTINIILMNSRINKISPLFKLLMIYYRITSLASKWATNFR
jgi:hypothetical protein